MKVAKSENPKILSRRDLLGSIAGLLATTQMPAEKILPVLETETPKWSLELVKALPFLDALDPISLGREFDTMEDVRNGKVTRRYLTSKEVFIEDSYKPLKNYAESLSVAWDNNLMLAVDEWLARSIQALEKVLSLGIDIAPKNLFWLLGQEENREKIDITLSRYTRQDMFLSKDYFDVWSKVSRYHPALQEADSMREFIYVFHYHISEALKLSVEDGCLDYVAMQRNIGRVHQLLAHAPELFPQENLFSIQALAEDISANGRQTIRLADVADTESNWIRTGNLLCRTGPALSSNAVEIAHEGDQPAVPAGESNNQPPTLGLASA